MNVRQSLRTTSKTLSDYHTCGWMCVLFVQEKYVEGVVLAWRSGVTAQDADTLGKNRGRDCMRILECCYTLQEILLSVRLRCDPRDK